jgi:hypothetical protein
VRQVGLGDALTAVLDPEPDAPRLEPLAADLHVGAVRGFARAVRSSAQAVAGVRDQVHERRAQALAVGHDARGFGIEPQPAGQRGGAFEPGLRRLAHERGQVHRRRLDPQRPREVEHVAHHAVEPRDLGVDVGGGLAHLLGPGGLAPQRAQRALDDHERIADLVRDDGGEPAEGREPLAQRRLALEARDRVGERAEAARHEPRVLVVPGPSGADPARQVAGGRDLLHRVGERGERTRHRARDRPAQQHAHRDRRERGQQQRVAQRPQRPERLGA